MGGLLPPPPGGGVPKLASPSNSPVHQPHPAVSSPNVSNVDLLGGFSTTAPTAAAATSDSWGDFTSATQQR